MQESGLAIPSVFCQVSCYPSVALPLSFRYPSVLLVRHHTRDGNESQGCSTWDLAGSPTDLSICRWDDLLVGRITINGEGVDTYRWDDIPELHRMPKNSHSRTTCSSNWAASNAPKRLPGLGGLSEYRSLPFPFRFPSVPSEPPFWKHRAPERRGLDTLKLNPPPPTVAP